MKTGVKPGMTNFSAALFIKSVDIGGGAGCRYLNRGAQRIEIVCSATSGNDCPGRRISSVIHAVILSQ